MEGVDVNIWSGASAAEKKDGPRLRCCEQPLGIVGDDEKNEAAFIYVLLLMFAEILEVWSLRCFARKHMNNHAELPQIEKFSQQTQTPEHHQRKSCF